MIEKWEEWCLNEINGCCLFIRDSSRLFHSDLILTSSLCHSNNMNVSVSVKQTNKQWHRNDRMIEDWVEWGLNEINGCCLFIRDSSRLFHLDLILTSFLCHSINIYIRSCIKWYWNDRMIEEWVEWGLNEINGCCLFIRDSSRLFHSDLFLTSFLCHS